MTEGLTPREKRTITEQAELLRGLRDRLSKVERAQDLRWSTIRQGEGPQIVDADGNVIGEIGGQDGLYAHKSKAKPATPSAPLVEGGAGFLRVTIVEGSEPRDAKLYVIHASTEAGYQVNPGTGVGSILPGDSSVTINLPGGIWHVRAQWMSLAGVHSDASDPVTVEVSPLVDEERIQEVLDEAQGRIDEARGELAAAVERVQELSDQWNETDLPALKEQLDANDAAVAEAEGRLDDAEAEIQESARQLEGLENITLPALDQRLEANSNALLDAEGRIEAARGIAENLRDNVLPGLSSALGAVESVIEDHGTRIDNAHAAANQARSTAEGLRDVTLPALEGRLVDNEAALDEAEGRLDDTRLGMENLRDVRLPGLQDALNSGLSDANEWREVGAISASSLRVGNFSNLITDPHFQEEWDQVGGWQIVSGGIDNAVRPFWSSQGVYVLRPSPVSDITIQARYGRDRLNAQPGESYRFTARAFENLADGARVGVRVGYTGEFPGFIWHDAVHYFDGTPGRGLMSYEWTVPDNRAIRKMFIQVIMTRTATSGHTGVYSPSVTRMTAGYDLLAESVGARHIMAEEVAAAVGEFLEIRAEQIDTTELAAHLATIIELDAAQITSGKIDTSRLDAETVAAEVANFLTLDALEINVEELAGQIANIIDITAETVRAARAVVSAPSIAAPLTEEDSWTLTGTATWDARSQPNRGRAIRITPTSGTGTAGNAYSEPFDVTPGEQLRLTATMGRLGSNRSQGGRWYFGIVGVNDQGTTTSFGPYAYSNQSSSENWGNQLDGVITIPSGVYRARLRLLLEGNASTAGEIVDNAHTTFYDVHARRLIDGNLLVDNAVGARHVVAEEIAAAIGQFIQVNAENIDTEALAANIAAIITLNANRITSGTLDTARLNATQVAAHIANVINLNASRITSGTINSNRINVTDLAARIATIIELNASRITSGTIGAARIDTLSLFSDMAFVENLYSSVINAIQITTERIITGSMIATETIDVSNLNVTEQMTAAFLQAKKVEAGEIAGNAFQGGTFTGGIFEGSVVRGGRFETHTAPDRGVKITPDGRIVVYDTTGNTRLAIGGGLFNSIGGRISAWESPNLPRITLKPAGESQSGGGTTNAGVFFIRDGSSGIPALSVVAGMYIQNPANTGTESLRLRGQNGGSVVIDTDVNFDARGSQTDLGHTIITPGTATQGLTVRSSNGQDRVVINNGFTDVYNNMSVPDNFSIRSVRTTSANPNTFIDSNGIFYRNTSASRYKMDQQVVDVPDDILNLDVKDWIDKHDLDRRDAARAKKDAGEELDWVDEADLNPDLGRVTGLVAEDVEAIDPRYVVYDEDGQVEGLNYTSLSLTWLPIVRRQRDRIDDLESTVSTLEARLATLEAKLA